MANVVNLARIQIEELSLMLRKQIGMHSLVTLSEMNSLIPAELRIDLPFHLGPIRSRFEVATSVAQYFLNYTSPPRTYVNWFAISFLAPKALFIEKASQFQGNIEDICSEFGLSRGHASAYANYLGVPLS